VQGLVTGSGCIARGVMSAVKPTEARMGALQGLGWASSMARTAYGTVELNGRAPSPHSLAGLRKYRYIEQVMYWKLRPAHREAAQDETSIP